jgi:hypothetical protein
MMKKRAELSALAEMMARVCGVGKNEIRPDGREPVKNPSVTRTTAAPRFSPTGFISHRSHHGELRGKLTVYGV